MLVALAGNQNCGKTTLFNALTGSNQHVGNFPGVTVDSKIGYIKGYNEIEICDLPGIYSLSPYSNEEIVSRDFLIKKHPDVILNIIDVTNIERNLYLTLQLAELGIPMIICLSMMDEMTSSGNSVDIKGLENKLGIKCIPVIASKGEGIDDIIHTIRHIYKNTLKANVIDLCPDTSPVHRAIHGMMTQITDHAQEYHVPVRYAATHLLEGDMLVADEINLSENERDIVGHMIKEMTDETGYDNEVTMAMMRYDYIDNLCKLFVKKVNIHTYEQERSLKIDRIVTNKWLAFPLFILIMGLVFYLTFDLIGGNLQTLLDKLISGSDSFSGLIGMLREVMENAGYSTVSISILCDGILSGVGSVLTFLPIVILLFFFLSLLEDSGYMARIAFIMDKPLRKIGLSGRSFVPMLIGFGCSVPAVMSARTLASEKEKRLTLGIIPFMPCTAKLPIMASLCIGFFSTKPNFLIILCIYLFSVSLGILLMAVIHKIKHSKATPFMMELPAYRIPTLKNTIILMWEKVKDFLHKAFTIILVASFVIWFLSSFNYQLLFCGEGNIHGLGLEDSLLAYISKFIVYLFYPIGVTDWRIASAIITGLSAKEAVVSTMGILSLTSPINMNIAQSIAFYTFVLLYMPCFATYSAYASELKSFKKATVYMLVQTLIAYLLAALLFGVISLFLLI